jgi:hypothetical protein
MSVYDRIYSAQIAPCSADWREAIRNGIDVVDDDRRWTESIAENAFLPTTRPVPVVLSHDESRPVGEVVVRIAHRGWFHVDFRLDASKLLACVAADRLKVGTPVSIGFRTLGHDKSLAEKVSCGTHSSASTSSQSCGLTRSLRIAGEDHQHLRAETGNTDNTEAFAGSAKTHGCRARR